MNNQEDKKPEKINKKPEKIDNRPVASGSFVGMEADKRHLTDFDRYVFTSAQNNTHVHTDFLKSLVETYCEHNLTFAVGVRVRLYAMVCLIDLLRLIARDQCSIIPIKRLYNYE